MNEVQRSQVRLALLYFAAGLIGTLVGELISYETVYQHLYNSAKMELTWALLLTSTTIPGLFIWVDIYNRRGPSKVSILLIAFWCASVRWAWAGCEYLSRAIT